MALPDIFSADISESMIERINALSSDSGRLWGKMSVTQMLAHCSVTYELVYEPEKHRLPNAFMRLVLKIFVKKVVVNEKPFKQNNPTGPQFIINDERDFQEEKTRLIDFIRRTRQLGRSEFEGRSSVSFGKLTADEWNNMFFKHLDHHLRQFGV